MKLNNREKIFFYFCVSLAVFMFLDKAIFQHLSGRLSELNNEVKLKETRLMKGMKQQEQKQKIIKEFKECERYLKLRGSDEEITSEFLREIETIARQSSVVISDIKPRSVNKFNTYKEYLVEVKLDAPLEDIANFLYALNNSILLLKTDKLILTLKDENDNVLRGNMLISGIIVL